MRVITTTLTSPLTSPVNKKNECGECPLYYCYIIWILVHFMWFFLVWFGHLFVLGCSVAMFCSIVVLLPERDHIIDSLAKCGYPQWALFCTGPTVKPLDAEPKKKEDCAKGFVTIPYVKGVSENIRRALRRQKITTAFKPMGSIKSPLVLSKDKVPSRIKDNLEATCSSCVKRHVYRRDPAAPP